MKAPRESTRKARGLTSAGMLTGGAAAVAIMFFAWILSGSSSPAPGVEARDIYTVTRGDFMITIPASGQLTSPDQVEIRCELDGRNNAITEIVEEGTLVKTGDLLFAIDDESLKDKIRGAQEELVQAENNVRKREATLEIMEATRISELQKAQVKIDQAELALRAWREGEVRTALEQNELEVRTARKDHERLREKYQKSISLYDQKFISKDDLEKDEIAMIRAAANLNKSILVQEMYEKYTFNKEKLQKESDLDQAVAEKDRTKKRTDAEVRTCQDDVEAALKTRDSKQERLAKWENQLEMCVVMSPTDGMVVYGSTLDRRRRDDDPLQVGSTLYRNQLVIAIPDTTTMAADVKVNEALSGLIEPGQTAVIRTDAFPDAVLDGIVSVIGVIAEDGGWRDPNRRDYSVSIGLTNPSDLALKPSMRVKVDIHVDTVEGAAFVPVQAIFQEGRRSFVYREVSGGFEQQVVTVGQNSELYAEIVEGLAEGDRVLLVEPSPTMVVKTVDDPS